VRLQKFLARAGVASRRKSEALITAGRVSIDGVAVTRLGTSVDPASQRVEVDGCEVRIPAVRWLALHKLPGTLCSRGDPQGRPTIYDSIPPDAHALFHVGRLDYMSEGLVLLTNDGEVAHRLLHPSTGLTRRYRVALVGPAPVDLPRGLVTGVMLEDGEAAATRASWIVPPESKSPVVTLTLHEGRNREIRRMLAALGVRVRWLKRVAFGPIALGDLARGETRALSRDEIASLAGVAKPGITNEWEG